MSCVFITILKFLLSTLIFLKVTGLKVLPKGDNLIIQTGEITKAVTKELFSALKADVDENVVVERLFALHKDLVAVATHDSSSLKEITKLTRPANNWNHDTDIFTAVFNSLQDEISKLSIYKRKTDLNAVIEKFKKNEHDSASLSSDSFYLIPEYIIDFSVQDNLQLLASFNNDTSEEHDTVWAPQKVERRIFNGARIKIKYLPFMAAVLIFNQFQCAGSIIKSDLIISAASCLQLAWNNRFFRENPNFLSVRIGSKFYNGGGETVPVLEVYFHPDYNPKSLKNNLCILRLLRKIKFRKRSRNVKKIKFDTDPSTLSESKTEGIMVGGWGSRSSGDKIISPWHNPLTYAVLDVYGLPECMDIYGREYVTKLNFCAGFISQGGGACNRDVGGPGIINGVLVGVVSFGSPECGAPDTPTVFTKLGHYAEWIEDIIHQKVPSHGMKTTLKGNTDYNHGFTTNAKTKFYTSIDSSTSTAQISNSRYRIPKHSAETKEIEEYEEKIYKDILNKTFYDNLKSTPNYIENDTKVTDSSQAPGRFTMLDDEESQSYKYHGEYHNFLNSVNTTENSYDTKQTAYDFVQKRYHSENAVGIENKGDNSVVDRADSASEELGLRLPESNTFDVLPISDVTTVTSIPVHFLKMPKDRSLTDINANDIESHFDELYKFISRKKILEIINGAVNEEIEHKTRKLYLGV